MCIYGRRSGSESSNEEVRALVAFVRCADSRLCLVVTLQRFSADMGILAGLARVNEDVPHENGVGTEDSFQGVASLKTKTKKTFLSR